MRFRGRSGSTGGRRRGPGRGSRGPRMPSSASSGAASPGSGRRSTRSRGRRPAASSCVESDWIGSGSERSQRWLRLGVAHPRDRQRPRPLPGEVAVLERLRTAELRGDASPTSSGSGSTATSRPGATSTSRSSRTRSAGLAEEAELLAASVTTSSSSTATGSARRLPRRPTSRGSGTGPGRLSSTRPSSPTVLPRPPPSSASDLRGHPGRVPAEAGRGSAAAGDDGRGRGPCGAGPARHQRVPAAAPEAPPLHRPGLRLRAGQRAAHG